MNFSEDSNVLDEKEYVNLADICGASGFYINLLNTYYLPSMSIVGIIGNCLSFTVFMSPHLKMRSSSYYLSALAVADLGFLTVVIVVQCSFNGILEIYNIDGWCQFFVYTSSVCATLSVWLIVAFTVERFIAVQYPLQRPRICTVRRARIIVSVLISCALLTQMYVFWIAGIIEVDGDRECEMLPQYHDLMKTVNFVDTILTLIIPLVLILLMNTMIAKGLIVFRRKLLEKELCGRHHEEQGNAFECRHVETQSDNTHKKSMRNSFLLRDKRYRTNHLSLCEEHPQKHLRTSESSLSSRNQHNITKMLFIISSVFVTLNLPSYVIRIWIFFAFTLFEKSLPEVWWCMQQVAMMLYYTNFSVNFILYTMCGATFRRCLWKLIRWK